MKIVKTNETKLKNRTSRWQLKKVRTIIKIRWDEVWKIAVERDRFLKRLQRYHPNQNI